MGGDNQKSFDALRGESKKIWTPLEKYKTKKPAIYYGSKGLAAPNFNPPGRGD